MSVGVHSGSADDSPRSSNTSGVSIDLESIRLHASSFVARIQSRISLDTIRPVPVFLGIDPAAGFCFGGTAFTPPIKKVDKASLEKVKSRVSLNWNYFLSNYALVAAMTALVVALMHPGMLIFIAVVYGLWMLHSFMIRNELILFGVALHSLLSVQQRFYALFTLTTIVVVMKCLAPAVVFFFITGFLILTHALFRDPKHIEYTNEMMAAEGNDEEDYVDSPGDSARRGDVI